MDKTWYLNQSLKLLNVKTKSDELKSSSLSLRSLTQNQKIYSRLILNYNFSYIFI